MSDRLTTPIRSLELSKRALHACEVLGIESVGDALACDLARFSTVPNCGRRTWERFIAQVRAFAGPDAARPTPRGPSLLPVDFLDLECTRLLLPDAAFDAMRQRQVATLGELLADADGIAALAGERAIAALRAELARLLRAGIERFLDELRADGDDFSAFLDRLRSCCLDRDELHLLELRAGIGRRPERRWHLAAKWRVSENELAARERAIVARVHTEYGTLLARFRAELDAELDAFDDVLTGHRPAPGTLLHSALAWSGDPDLALRLAALLFPDELFHHGTFLSRTSPETIDRVIATMRPHVRRGRLPRPVLEIRALLAEAGFELSADLVAHVGRTRLNRTVEIDPVRGEVFNVKSSSVADRLHALLEEHDQPTHLDELLFAYRERHRRCNRNTLRDHLRADSRFLEIGKHRWSLRDRHLDELEFARAEARRIADLICSVGGRHAVDEFAERGGYAERQLFLIADSLRSDPSVRDLGRQEFCPRHQANSQVMGELLRALRRAAGEIPVSRFLTNQSPARRRLVETLLCRNRMFVSAHQDRIDLLTNYPFDAGRMRRTLIVADQCLEQFGGYATLAQIKKGLEAAGLGGGFLSETLLLDVLRRNGRYEFLAGGIVAQASLRLGAWIMQRIRETLRAAGPLTVSQLVAERPELAEFADSLDDLMHRDPLLQSDPSDRFEVV